MELAIVVFFAGAFFGSTLDLVLLLLITFAAGSKSREKGEERHEK